MSSISTQELSPYIRQRLAQIRWWFRLGWLLLLAIGGMYGWLWQEHRLYVDPTLVLDKLRAGQIGEVEVAKLATLGNLAFIGCGVLLVGLVLITYVAMWTEARTIRHLTVAASPVVPETKTVESNDDTQAQ